MSTLVLFGPFCPLWSTSVLFGTFNPLWFYSVHFGSVCPLWSYLVWFGPIRSILSTSVLFGPLVLIRSYPVHFVPIWSYVHLVHFVPLGPFGSHRFILVHLYLFLCTYIMRKYMFGLKTPNINPILFKKYINLKLVISKILSIAFILYVVQCTN